MSSYNVLFRRSKGQFLAPLLFLFFAFQLVFPAITFASQHDRNAEVDPPQSLARAGVSVVRLLVTYRSANGAEVECTGLGALVASWPNQGLTDQNNWVLTDGNLVNSDNKATCASKQSGATLSSVLITFSSSYTPQLLTIPSLSPFVVHCSSNPCSNGMAAFAFNTDNSHTQPSLSLAGSDTSEVAGIGLTKNATSQDTPSLSSTNDPQNKKQFEDQIAQFLTLNQLPVQSGKLSSEIGTPIVNTNGELSGLLVSGNHIFNAQEIGTFLGGMNELKAPPVNPLRDNWNAGINNYYRKNYQAAHDAFQAAAAANPQFIGAQNFAQTATTHLSTQSMSANSNSSASDQSGQVGGGIIVPLIIILLLVYLIPFFVIRNSRRQEQRRLRDKLARAESKATVDAQRVIEMEALRQKALSNPPLPPQGALKPVVLNLGEAIKNTPIRPVEYEKQKPIPIRDEKVANLTYGSRQGQRLGNYRIMRLLGDGGFADVYLGEHIFLKTQAAIKVIRTSLTSEMLTNFIGEARTIAQLTHPHIVRVLEFGVEGKELDPDRSILETEGRIPFLIMEYAPEGTLRKRHPKGTRLPLSTIVPYVKQAADALQYAHDQKLIHRDIKPENMLIGHGGKVLMSDFGIATVAHSENSMSIQEMAGTVPYMAPEQIRYRPQTASDQYALAVVVYEWICGVRPFIGSQWEIIDQHLNVLPSSPRGKAPALPREAEEVILKALAKEPTQRFDSVKAFALALEQALHRAETT